MSEETKEPLEETPVTAYNLLHPRLTIICASLCSFK